MEVVAISQAPSPESNPNSPSPVISLVGPYPTINLIGQSFLWSIVLKGLPSSISRLAVWRPQHTCPKRGKHDAFPYLSLFIAPHTDVLPSGHKSSSCQSVTHMSPLPLSLLPASCPKQHNTGTTVLFLLLPGLLSHTPFSTLSLVTTPSSTCVTTPFQAQQTTHTKTRADKCYSTGVTTMKYLLLVLALQFTGLSFSIPRFTKLILTDLMSHPQSRFFVHLYLGMHGLIFNTSI